MQKTILSVRELSANYGPIRALRGVSLQVREGETVAVVGANGAGKTRLMRAVSGIWPRSGGSANFDGIEIGKATIARPGSDFTIVATGRMRHEATKAAEQLATDGVDVEVIDPVTLSPFDTATVVASVKKTHRALVVHEAVRFGGFGAEIAAQIQELAFDYLDAPIARLGAPFAPVPFSPALEKLYLPNAEKIVAEVKRTLGRAV